MGYFLSYLKFVLKDLLLFLWVGILYASPGVVIWLLSKDLLTTVCGTLLFWIVVITLMAHHNKWETSREKGKDA